MCALRVSATIKALAVQSPIQVLVSTLACRGGGVYANSEGHLMKCSKAFSSRELLNEGSGS